MHAIGTVNQKSAYDLPTLFVIYCLVMSVIGLFLGFNFNYLASYLALFVLVVLTYFVLKSCRISLVYKIPIFFYVSAGLVQRVFFLIADPYMFSFDFFEPLTDDLLSNTLLYASLSQLILLILFSLEGVIYKKPIMGLVHTNNEYVDRLFIVSGYYYFISFFMTFVLGVFFGVGMQGGEPSSMGFLIRIFDIETGLSIALISYFLLPDDRSKRFARLAYVIAFTYIAFSVYRGSRSSILMVLLMVWFARAAIIPDLRVSRAAIVKAATLLVLIGIPIFYLGWAFRYLHSDNIAIDFNMFADMPFFNVLSMVSLRLGEADTLVMVSSGLERNGYQEYATFDALMDAIIKGLVPSFIYQQKYLSIDQVFPYVFRDLPLDILHAEHWTGLGACVAYFGHDYAPIYFALIIYLFIKFGENSRKYFKDDSTGVLFSVIFSYALFLPLLTTGSMALVGANYMRFLIVFFILNAISKKINYKINVAEFDRARV